MLQVDGYSGFKSLLEGRRTGEIRLAFCWAHCRRRFYEIHQATGSPLAEEALRRIGELYRIEAEIRGRPAEERRAVRQERSKPAGGGAARLAGRAAGAGLGTLHPGRGAPLRPAPLGRAGVVPRGWPARAGHERGRASDPADCSRAPQCPVRRQRWRGASLGDRGEPGGEREAERGRAAGLAHRRARAHGRRAGPRRTSSSGCCPGAGRPSGSRRQAMPERAGRARPVELLARL